jgi:hypothetical protein
MVGTRSRAAVTMRIPAAVLPGIDVPPMDPGRDYTADQNLEFLIL